MVDGLVLQGYARNGVRDGAPLEDVLLLGGFVWLAHSFGGRWINQELGQRHRKRQDPTLRTFSGCHCTPQTGSPPFPSIVETKGRPPRSALAERTVKLEANRASPRNAAGLAPLWWLFMASGSRPAAAKSRGSIPRKRRLWGLLGGLGKGEGSVSIRACVRVCVCGGHPDGKPRLQQQPPQPTNGPAAPPA